MTIIIVMLRPSWQEETICIGYVYSYLKKVIPNNSNNVIYFLSIINYLVVD